MHANHTIEECELSANSIECRKFLRRRKYKTILLFVIPAIVIVGLLIFVKIALDNYFY